MPNSHFIELNIRQYWIWNLDNHWLFLSSQRRKDISWFGQSDTYLWVPTSHSQRVLMVNTGELRTARLYRSQQDDLCPIPSIFSDPHMRYYLFFLFQTWENTPVSKSLGEISWHFMKGCWQLVSFPLIHTGKTNCQLRKTTGIGM